MTREFFAATAALALLVGCNTTTKSSPTEQTAPLVQEIAAETPAQSALPDGNGAIKVFRTNTYGLLLSPKVFVDGTEEGICAPRKAFMITKPAGNHIVSASTLGEEKVNVPVQAGKITYVECSIGFGVIAGRVNLAVTSNPKKIAKANRL